MIRNYISIALRGMRKHILYAGLNRVSLGPGTLILAGLLALAAAMATVAYHAWQAARMNPADSLRYE